MLEKKQHFGSEKTSGLKYIIKYRHVLQIDGVQNVVIREICGDLSAIKMVSGTFVDDR